MDTKLKPKDFKRYLAALCFGTDKPGFRRYIDRAYRDFNRTLHTTDAPKVREERVEAAAQGLSARLVAASVDKKFKCKSEADFDRWHAETCEALIAAFGGDEMLYGHAQKWLNTTLKYLFTAFALGLEDIGKIESCYPFAHMPIDNTVLNELAAAGFEFTCPRPWSKLTKDDYLAFQSELRKTYKECRMDVEFILWRGDGRPKPKS